MAESPSPQGRFPRDWVGDVWAWLRRAGGWFGGDGLGRWGERVAEEHLRQRGYRILARSHRSLLGEIDLIARDGDWVVFVEVKTRTGSAKGHPVEAVDARKQRRIVRLAEQWLKRHPVQRGARVRFDVIGVLRPADGTAPVITHLEHAFRG